MLSRGVVDSVDQYRLKDPSDCDAEIIANALYGIPRRFVAGVQVLFNFASLLLIVLLLVSSLWSAGAL